VRIITLCCPLVVLLSSLVLLYRLWANKWWWWWILNLLDSKFIWDRVLDCIMRHVRFVCLMFNWVYSFTVCVCGSTWACWGPSAISWNWTLVPTCYSNWMRLQWELLGMRSSSSVGRPSNWSKSRSVTWRMKWGASRRLPNALRTTSTNYGLPQLLSARVRET